MAKVNKNQARKHKLSQLVRQSKSVRYIEKKRQEDRYRLPSDKQLAEISSMLYKQFRKEESLWSYVSVKETLTLLGRGALLAALFMVPGSGKGLKKFTYDKNKSSKEWRRYNLYELKRTLKRLQEQRLIKFTVINNQPAVEITENGKKRIIKYALDEIKIKKPLIWDGSWHLVIYDIPTTHKESREDLQRVLKRLKFLQLQKSVYLYPYPCEIEIDYLRYFLGIEKYVQCLLVEKLENGKAYKDYFGLS